MNDLTDELLVSFSLNKPKQGQTGVSSSLYVSLTVYPWLPACSVLPLFLWIPPFSAVNIRRCASLTATQRFNHTFFLVKMYLGNEGRITVHLHNNPPGRRFHTARRTTSPACQRTLMSSGQRACERDKIKLTIGTAQGKKRQCKEGKQLYSDMWNMMEFKHRGQLLIMWMQINFHNKFKMPPNWFMKILMKNRKNWAAAGGIYEKVCQQDIDCVSCESI